MIDEMVRRSREENIDKNGKKFAAYSQSYIKSNVFKIYGKSKGDVNLTLAGEMLSNMAVKNKESSNLEISFLSQEQNDKAHGHINGIKTRSGGKVVRDFFGLPEDVQGKILKQTLTDFNLNPEAFDRLEGLSAEDIVAEIADRVEVEG
jgi:hypothetical protein